jgi:glutamate racemase
VIGVFDSGFGGLTVHRALVEALPERDFVYLGDNRNAPYGTRPPIEILNLTCAGIERLFAEGCTLVILACNTASTVALRWIQQQWLPARQGSDDIKRNVLGVVVPTIEAATGIGWEQGGPATEHQKPFGTIAVFATNRTVQTGCYPFEICKRAPGVKVVQQACPHLAGSIEAGASRDELRSMVDVYVGELLTRVSGAPDCVILGCTHYPLVADLFAAALPPSVQMIHQPDATARAMKLYLERHPEYDRSHSGRRVFLSTGLSPQALPLIEKFWGDKLPFQPA